MSDVIFHNKCSPPILRSLSLTSGLTPTLNRWICGFAFGYAQICSTNFTYPKNVIRNAVPKKDKKEGRENLKTEKVFIWKKSLLTITARNGIFKREKL